MGMLKSRCKSAAEGMLGSLRRGCDADAGKVALIDEETSVSYMVAYRSALRLACRLRKTGVNRGDVVVLCMSNGAAFVVALAACEAVGATSALIAPTIAVQEMKRRLDLLVPAACIVDEICDLGEAIDGCEAVLIPSSEVLAHEDDGRPILDVPKVYEEIPRSDCGVIVFTSGSTGLPRAIVCDLGAVFHNASCMNESYSATSDDVFFIPLPFSHVFGLLGACSAVAAGATLATLKRYSPVSAADMLCACRATIEYGVSTILLRQLSLSGELDMGETLRAFIVGGDSCPAQLAADFERKFGCEVVQSWGMSEASSTLTAMPIGEPVGLRAESVGFAIDGVELSVDIETGELLCRAPTLARYVLDEGGYRPLPVDDGGWFHTGDVGSIDVDGAVRILGRIKDIVVRGGMNIYPAEVERAYRENPDIIECCLVGFADEELGERTCLFTVLRGAGTGTDDKKTATPSTELREWGRGRIEKCRIPDIVLLVGKLPLLPNGKVNKKALRGFADQWIRDCSSQFKRRPEARSK